MDMVHGSTTKAAEVLGISVRKIQYRLKEFAAEARGESSVERQADDKPGAAER